MRSYYLKYIYLFKLVQTFVRYVKKNAHFNLLVPYITLKTLHLQTYTSYLKKSTN